MTERTPLKEKTYIERNTTDLNRFKRNYAWNACNFFVILARFWYVEDVMDIPLYNDMYLDFRSKLLGPVFSTDEIFAIMAKNWQKIFCHYQILVFFKIIFKKLAKKILATFIWNPPNYIAKDIFEFIKKFVNISKENFDLDSLIKNFWKQWK